MVVEKEAKSEGFRKYLPVTFLIGTGFFTMGLMDPLYDSYVTIFLSKFIPFKWLVGIFMSLDNILAIFLIPIISALSDKTRTKIGRRMPWIVVLLPLSAVMFTFIPYSAQHSLSALIIVLALLNLFKQSVRGPVVALMPDIVPAEFRSQGDLSKFIVGHRSSEAFAKQKRMCIDLIRHSVFLARGITVRWVCS